MPRCHIIPAALIAYEKFLTETATNAAGRLALAHFVGKHEQYSPNAAADRAERRRIATLARQSSVAADKAQRIVKASHHDGYQFGSWRTSESTWASLDKGKVVSFH